MGVFSLWPLRKASLPAHLQGPSVALVSLHWRCQHECFTSSGAELTPYRRGLMMPSFRPASPPSLFFRSHYSVFLLSFFLLPSSPVFFSFSSLSILPLGECLYRRDPLRAVLRSLLTPWKSRWLGWPRIVPLGQGSGIVCD